MTIAYPNIAERLFGRPLAIEPFALRAIMDGPLAKRVLAGERLEAKRQKKGGRDIRRDRLATIVNAEQVRSQDGIVDYGLTADGIAIIPIAGVLSRRFDWLAAACGFTTYEAVGATLQAALDDYRVKAVLFDVDSPGGEVDGMLDLGDAVLAARARMPIWAVANSLAASAAYSIAGSADKLLTPRLAQIGSLGCVTIHVDQSAADEARGLAYTAIYSGARKVDGWGHAPLSDAALASAQAGVDHVRNEFAALVERQGRISAKDMLATEAAVYADQAAVDIGLADAIGTFADALAGLKDEVSPSKGARTMSKPNAAAAAATTAAAPVVSATAAQPEPTAVVAAPTPARAEMTPPEPGEECKLCGAVKPKATVEAPATAGVAAGATPSAQTVAVYGATEIGETIALCKVAKVPSAADHFIAAKTPLEKVRAQLCEMNAAASDAAGIQPHITVGDGSGASSSEAIIAGKRDLQKKLKAEGVLGIRQ